MKSNVINAVFDMSSGYLGDWFKADLAWIGAINFQDDYRCSEVAFCSKKTDIVDGKTQIWAHNDMDGVALQKATLGVKSQIGDLKWRLRGGYDQLNAGVLSNNWGFLFPGSYRGAQFDAEVGGLSINYAWTDSYRTPWATEFGYFLDPAGKRLNELQTVGLKYRWDSGLFAEVAGGESTGWQSRYFGKVGWQGKAGASDLSANYQYYRFDVIGQDFIGRENSFGVQNVVSLGLTSGGWNLSLEYVATQVNFWCTVPEFVPRMSAGYGNSQGRLDYWWNAVSDFNKDGEQAFNLGIRPAPLTLGTLAISTGGNLIAAQNISGFDKDHFRTDSAGFERGYNLDLGFSFSEGSLKPISTSIHYTHLEAGGDALNELDPGSLYSRYGLYSTDDLKIMVIFSKAFSG